MVFFLMPLLLNPVGPLYALQAALNVHLKLNEQTGEVEEFHQRIESMFQKHWG